MIRNACSPAIFTFLIVVLAISVQQPDVLADDGPLSKRIANYDLDVALDADEKLVTGTAKLTWFNTSAQPVQDLFFHLYLNAFRHERTTFMKESGGHHRGGSASFDEADRGWIDVRSIVTGGDTISADSMRFVQPDDGNKDDETVLRVGLKRPVMPGNSIHLTIGFVSKLPRAFARTGFTDDDLFLVGQWFPKIGVLEVDDFGRGTWNCHQFHGASEFYANFGVYTLAVRVPSDLVVGANGALHSSEAFPDGTTRYVYRQEDVIDCVWTAYRHFLVFDHTVKMDSGRLVEVRLLLHPVREKHIERYRAAIDAMFWYFAEWYGPYPYSTLTIVDPPPGDGATIGGMEYPAFITTGSDFGPLSPSGLHFLEEVLFHEFAHQYFQSIVATNEFESPWMDEGFTSYSEHRALSRYFGEKTGTAAGSNVDVLDFQYSSLAYNRAGYIRSAHYESMERFAWEFSSRSAYTVLNYAKPTLMLETLGNYLGEPVWSNVLKRYYEEWKFGHPTAADFIEVVNRVSGRDLNWFFDQAVYDSRELDYEVARISNRRADSDTGAADPVYEGHVLIRRRGDFVFPVELKVTFADGSTEEVQWDGEGAFRRFEFEPRATRIVKAEIDPNNKIVLDTNLANNGRVVKSDGVAVNRYVLRWMFWVQQLLQTVIALI